MQSLCSTRAVKVLKYLHCMAPATVPRSNLYALEKLPQSRLSGTPGLPVMCRTRQSLGSAGGCSSKFSCPVKTWPGRTASTLWLSRRGAGSGHLQTPVVVPYSACLTRTNRPPRERSR
jgi:hypothetical protein